MKRVLILSITIVGALFIALTLPWFPTDDTPAIQDTHFADIQPYLMKHKKIPHALRRPDEWFYRQRAYPYDNIDAGKPL